MNCVKQSPWASHQHWPRLINKTDAQPVLEKGVNPWNRLTVCCNDVCSPLGRVSLSKCKLPEEIKPTAAKRHRSQLRSTKAEVLRLCGFFCVGNLGYLNWIGHCPGRNRGSTGASCVIICPVPVVSLRRILPSPLVVELAETAYVVPQRIR